MQSLISVLVVMTCCGMLAATPARSRRSLPLPDGLPLEMLFAACGDSSDQNDIGPCVEELLAGVIELATPSFSTGLEVGGKTVVLEPLSIDDIEPRNKTRRKKVKISATNIQVAGLSSLKVEQVSLQPDQLALNLTFSQLIASGDMTLLYSFFSAQPRLNLTLDQPSFYIKSDWHLQSVDGKLGINLSNVNVSIEIESFSTEIGNMSGLGRFLASIINNNNQILLDVFKPQLEKTAKRMLEKEFKTFKLSNN